MKTEQPLVVTKYDTTGSTEPPYDEEYAYLPPNPSDLGVGVQLKGEAKSVLIWPNPVLSTKCIPVAEFDNSLGQLLMDLVVTMNARGGIGLAAPQIGDNRRVIVVLTNNGPLGFINPKIVAHSGRYKMEEGCLSIPGYFEDRIRSQSVVISYVDMYNKECTGDFQGMLAFAIQHEIDHLNGLTFVDHLSNLKQSRIKKKITKTLRG